MPKGGEIHNHLAGAVYAETLIEIAADAGFCVDRTTLDLSPAYVDLKELARASIEHAFLPGASIWRHGRLGTPVAALAPEPLGGEAPADACRSLLAASEKAAMQWRLEAQFAAFEEDVSRRDQTIGQREG